MIYLVIYGFAIILCLMDVIKPFDRKKSRSVISILITIFTLFRGLRWETGTDWEQFYEVFQAASFSNIFSYERYGLGTELMEFGYVFLNASINWLFPYTVFLLAYNFALLYLYKETINKLTPKYHVFLFCFLLCTVAFFPLRQEMANTIMLFSLPFLMEKKYFKFVILCIIAASIHKSSIIMVLPFLLFKQVKIPSIALIVFYLSAYIVDLPVVQAIIEGVRPYVLLVNANYESGIDVYSNHIEDDTNAFNLFSLVMNLFLICLFCYARDKIDKLKNDRVYNLLLNLYPFYLFGVKLFQNIGMIYFVRIMKYFYFADVFLFGFILLNYKELSNKMIIKSPVLTKTILLFLLLVLSVNRFWGSCKLYPESSFPYISVFDSKSRDWSEKEPSFSIFFVDK